MTSMSIRVLGSFIAVLSLLASSGPARAAGAVEITPSLGMGQPSGTGSDEFDIGPEFAVGIGGRLHPQFSLTGHLILDRLSLENVPSSVDVSAWMIGLQILPALHFGQGIADFYVGPTLGLFRLSVGLEAGALDASLMVRGFQVGGRAGAMFTVNPTLALGPYFSYARLFATKACQEMGSAEICDDDPDNDDEGFWSLGIAARF